MKSTLLVTGAVVCLASACGTNGASHAASHNTPSTTPSVSTAPTVAPAATAAPGFGATPIPAGSPAGATESVAVAKSTVTATFYGYRQPVSVGQSFYGLASNFVGATADVKVCAGASPVTVSQSAWVLHYASGAVIDPASKRYPKAPQPAFPYTATTLAAHACTRGVVVYPVPAASKPESIAFSIPESTSRLSWRVS